MGRDFFVPAQTEIGVKLLRSLLKNFTTISIHEKTGCPIFPVSGPILNLYWTLRGSCRILHDAHMSLITL